MKYTLLLSVMFSFCTQSVIGQEKKVLPKGWDDIDPIDITEFWVKLPKIHPKDNAIDGLYEISQKIEKIPGYVELEKILADQGRTVWLEKGLELYPKMEPHLLRVDKLLDRQRVFEDFGGFNVNATTQKTIKLISLARYLELRVYVNIKSHEIDAAIHAWQQLQKLSDRVHADSYALVSSLVAAAIEYQLHKSADDLLSQPINHQQKTTVLNGVQRWLPIRENSRIAMQTEMLMVFNTIHHMYYAKSEYQSPLTEKDKESKFSYWQLVFGVNDEDLQSDLKKEANKRVAQLFLQPNKTFKYSYDLFKKQLVVVEATPDEMVDFMDQGLIEDREMNKKSKQLWTNLLGKKLWRTMASPLFKRQIPRMWMIKVNSDFVVIRDAVRRYEKDHKKLPDTLNMLVPKYLKSVPIDIFSKEKQVYQYDKEKRLLWGVGVDGEAEIKKLHAHEGELEDRGFSFGEDYDFPHTYFK